MTQIINYSEKAIAVVGDTKEIKDSLKAMGGKFNRYLSCGAGWIFSAKKREELEKLLNGKAQEPAQKSNVPADWEIYVSTYAKYNGGSLEGKWLHLCDYASKDEFLKACRELHKDEADPELMFQDASGVPSWMWGESSISDEIWSYKPEKEQKGAQSLAEKIAILKKYYKQADSPYHNKATDKQLEGWAKNCYFVLDVESRCYLINKGSIETRFCHPDEPEESVKAWWKVCQTYEYFEEKNLANLQQGQKRLADPMAYVVSDKWTGESWVAVPCYGQIDTNAQELTDTTRKALAAAYEKAIEMHKKRLQTWWKKYGAEKLHCWTYWADR